MMSTYRIGIIGCGTMARALAPRLAASGHFEIAAFWDPDPQAQAAMAALAPGAARADAAAVCAADVDLIYIASPPGSHLAYLAMAAPSGKAVLCEKPLAIDLAGAAALVARANSEGWRVAVNFGFAASPQVALLAELLRAGAIGRLERAEVRLRFRQWPRPWQADAAWLARRAQGGFGREVLSHFLFLLIRQLGAPSILTHAVRYPDDPAASETSLQAQLRIGDTPVRIDAAVEGEIDDDNACAFIGTEGGLRMFDWYRVQGLSGNEWRALGDDAGKEAAYRRTREGLVQQLRAFTAGEAHTLATLDEAWQVQRTVEALLR
jgi:predicted dehydrogenase